MTWPELADTLLAHCMGTFGREVTYTPTGGSSFTLIGIFDAPHMAIELREGSPYYSTTDPKLGVRLSDFAATPLQGDLVTIEGVEYAVVDFQPDGQGGATLVLEKN